MSGWRGSFAVYLCLTVKWRALLCRNLARAPRKSPLHHRARVVLSNSATMIGLFLSLFAHFFRSGWTGVNERTFVAVKPDGLQRRRVGEIVQRFEKKGFKLVGFKLMQASKELLREHYWEHRNRPFYNKLVSYMSSGPVVAMVWQGLDVVKTGRKMMGQTNPTNSMPGTFRGDFCVIMGRNVIHGSDSVESAQREISLWFKESELCDHEVCSTKWIYE